MPFTIPGADTAAFPKQAEPSPVDFRILSDGSGDTGVVSGCLVPSSMTLVIAVPSGSVRVAGQVVSVAGNTVTVMPDASNPLLALVSVPTGGVAVITHGTAAANPFAPDVPASSVALAMIYVPAASAAVAANQITDKQVIVPAPGAAGDTVIKKTADQAFTSTTLFVSDASLMIPVAANTDYVFSFFIIFQSAATTTGARFALSGPAGFTLLFVESKKQITVGGTASTDMFSTAIITAYDTAAPVSTAEIAANTNLYHRFEGIFRNGATAGNLVLRVQSEVVASAITVKVGSYVRYRAV